MTKSKPPSKPTPQAKTTTKQPPKKKIRPNTDYLGCKLTNIEKENWCTLTKDREILFTKFFDRETLVKLGMVEVVETLLNRGGLLGFLSKTADTYQRLTLEFLSTLEKLYDHDPPSCRFRLNNTTHIMSYATLRHIFGVSPREASETWTGLPTNEHIADFWFQLTHKTIASVTEKSSKIPHPGFRLIHRVLAMTFYCQGEPTNITRGALDMLWSMSPEGKNRPDWISDFVDSCIVTRDAFTGKITCGGMITLIAMHLGVPLEEEDRVAGFPKMDIDSLQRLRMIINLPERSTYAWLVDTTTKISYLRLPRPSGVAIPVGPTNKDLFIPIDPSRLIAVESQRRSVHLDESSDDEEMEDAGPSTEARSSHVSQPHLSMQEWRERVDDDTEEIRDELGYIRDQNVESLALQRSMSDMFLRMHPTEYRPPSPSVYNEIATRNLARSTRVNNRARRTNRRTCFGSCFGSSSSS